MTPSEWRDGQPLIPSRPSKPFVAALRSHACWGCHLPGRIRGAPLGLHTVTSYHNIGGWPLAMPNPGVGGQRRSAGPGGAGWCPSGQYDCPASPRRGKRKRVTDRRFRGPLPYQFLFVSPKSLGCRETAMNTMSTRSFVSETYTPSRSTSEYGFNVEMVGPLSLLPNGGNCAIHFEADGTAENHTRGQRLWTRLCLYLFWTREKTWHSVRAYTCVLHGHAPCRGAHAEAIASSLESRRCGRKGSRIGDLIEELCDRATDTGRGFLAMFLGVTPISSNSTQQAGVSSLPVMGGISNFSRLRNGLAPAICTPLCARTLHRQKTTNSDVRLKTGVSEHFQPTRLVRENIRNALYSGGLIDRQTQQFSFQGFTPMAPAPLYDRFARACAARAC